MIRIEPLEPGGHSPIEAVVDFSGAPAPVVIRRGKVELRFPNESLSGTGEILYRFLPEPRISIESKFQRARDINFEEVFVAGMLEPDMAFIFDGEKIEGFSTRRQAIRPAPANTDAANTDIYLDWNASTKPFYRGDKQADTTASVILHIFNFPKFRAERAVHFALGSFGALMILEDEHWRVEIQGLPQGATDMAWKRIDAEGGCYATHVAKLERKNAALFSGDAFEVQREMLASFLSFVRGRDYRLTCSIGMDAQGNTTWQGLDHPSIDCNVQSWFSAEHGKQAEDLFPLFSKRWNQSEAWKDCLQTAIYWYTQATTDGRLLGIGAAIILIQSALERLAYHFLVEDCKMISGKGFDDLRASDRIRMLFSVCGIPAELSDATPNILQTNDGFKKGAKWIDAPHAITDIRNSLVHPIEKKKVFDCHFDAWLMGLWYLELCILALCGYEGSYEDRMTGSVRSIPWKSK